MELWTSGLRSVTQGGCRGGVGCPRGGVPGKGPRDRVVGTESREIGSVVRTRVGVWVEVPFSLRRCPFRPSTRDVRWGGVTGEGSESWGMGGSGHTGGGRNEV